MTQRSLTRAVPEGRPSSPEDEEVPRLASGVELIGPYADSGLQEPPMIARRGDGQIVQLAPALFALAEEVDGRRTVAEIADSFGERIQRGVEPPMVQELLDGQLRRLGIVKLADGHTGQVAKVDPLLALKFRTKVIPDRVVSAITTVFLPLYFPVVMAIALGAFVGVDVWLFGFHGISQGLRHVLYQPTLLLLLLAGVVLATAFHEIGHATAVRYGGARPGVMGVGIYIVWPAFYTDITDAYRLRKWGRLRADTGGMYFNALFALATTAVFLATGFEPLLLLVVLQNFAIIQQSLPFLRLDGYYIISDLTGVPDMFSRVKPVLRSLLPGRPADPRVAELKPWVRRTVTGYVLTVVPVLMLALLLMLMHAPRAFATGYDSVSLHYKLAGLAFGHHRTLAGVVDVVQMLALMLPAAGLIYSGTRVGRRAGPAAWRWSAGSAARRSLVLAGTAAFVVGLSYLWWPHGDYRPIQPGERGTIVSAIRNLRHITSGRAGLTVARESQLGGAPFVSSRGQEEPRAHESSAKHRTRSGAVTPTGHSAPTVTTQQSTDDQTSTVPTTTTPATTDTTPTQTDTTPTTTSTTPTTTTTTTETTPTTTSTTPTP